ncbi:TetR/AcrR family transcriptional regulator [Bacillus xiapuensis]|uniref:TetR/AcrR family transcriptional regulator n=1 Tax=Bacillus xiapuensis TaxID=2014075 RepID=UPI000C24606C|nr:TetR/AcrR family transcriptional regulator [Bacillus xiapuensis]
MSPRKAVEQELTREMIMEAARDLFIENGYRHTSMRQIAKKLNYSHGAIYYHFKNKAALFFALVEANFSSLNEMLEEVMASSLSAEEKLENVLLGFIEYGMTNQSDYEIMFLIQDKELKRYTENAPDASYERFAAAIRELCPGQVTLKDTWLLFLSLHGFVTMYCRSGQTMADVEELAQAHVKFLLKAIRHD